jgi:hypothetical protein
MGNATPHVLGRNCNAFYAKAETTYGTFVQPAGTDAIKLVSPADFTFQYERKNQEYQSASRSRISRLTGKRTGSWSIEKYLLPSGTAGTAPDDGPLWKSLCGVETVTPATSVVYTLSALQTTLYPLSLVRTCDGLIMEGLSGCPVESMTLKVSGGSEPRVSFAGPASDLGYAGYSTLASTASNLATSIVVATADISQFANGGIVKVGSSDASGAGHLITAGGGTNTLTISPGLTGEQASGQVVAAFAPTQTTAGTPATGLLGSLTIDAGSAMKLTGFEITVKNNLKTHGDECFSSVVTDATPGWRDVSGKVSIRSRRDYLVHLFKRKTFATRALVCVIGTTAGSILTTTVPYAEFDATGIGKLPDNDEPVVEMPWTALGSSGEDEVTFSFT